MTLRSRRQRLQKGNTELRIWLKALLILPRLNNRYQIKSKSVWRYENEEKERRTNQNTESIGS